MLSLQSSQRRSIQLYEEELQIMVSINLLEYNGKEFHEVLHITTQCSRGTDIDMNHSEYLSEEEH